jgi:putative ABC transport system ATP-binding protein
MMAIELRNIKKVYNSGKPNEFTALNGVSLNITDRALTVLKGPSGSGKTTLLSVLGCMARPTSGRIRLHDREITSLPERFLAEIRRSTFGFIFQQFNLIKGITALENIMLPAYPGGEKRAVLEQRARMLLDVFSLGHKASARIEWLSGGEAQRAAIARALINDPSVVVADEPTAHLDSKLSSEFMDTMLKLKQEGRTILIASHDPLVYDSDFADRVVDIRDGAVIGEEARA